MKWIEVKVQLQAPDPHLAADLVADAFRDGGIEGVVIDDPTLAPDEGWGEDAVPLPIHHAVSGYLPATASMDDSYQALAAALSALEKRTEIRCRMGTREVDEEDWAEAWKAFFYPTRLGTRVVVKPTWRKYDPDKEDLVIEIDPGMAFGTGSHPTTMLCVQALETLVRPGISVLDIGTGSGILLATAALLGAESGLGIDIDPVAVSIAGDNLRLNNVSAEQFITREGDLASSVPDTFDLVVANILSEVILSLLDHVQKVCKPGAHLIFSGIVENNRAAVETKMQEVGIEVVDVLRMEEWVAIIGKSQ
jgi:ribosomal protein L11 methyltransferase